MATRCRAAMRQAWTTGVARAGKPPGPPGERDAAPLDGSRTRRRTATMDWLTPMTGLAVGAGAVPLLVALYFLKLKRREVPISSTLLWKRAVQDLQVNAPFQRLRRNLLLLLQLLALGAVLAALARPVLSLETGAARRTVILVDASGSMNATDVEPSRLAEAKRQAARVVEGLRAKRAWFLADTSDQAMVIAFSDRPRVLSNYTADKGRLRAALERIEPTDGPSKLAGAMALARAFATGGGEEETDRPAARRATLELFSDGRLADLDEVALPPGRFRYHRIGVGGANVAVAGLRARRSYERPAWLHVFAKVVNCGSEPAVCDVQLALGADVRGVKRVTVPPRSEGRPGELPTPGRTAVSFALEYPEAGVLEVRAVHDDVLPDDNAAWAVIEPPRALRVALVTKGNRALETALRRVPLGHVEVVTPAAFALRCRPGAVSPYGLAVIDGSVGGPLPRGNYLVFGPPVEGSGIEAAGELERQVMVDWHRKHPVLNFVDLDGIFAARCWKMNVPRDASVLAEFEDTPALVLVQRGGGTIVQAGFDVARTNWPYDAGFVMFCYNVMAYMATEARGAERDVTVGEPLVLETAGAEAATVTGPGGVEARVAADAAGRLRFAATHRAGLYRVAPTEGEPVLFAVNRPDDAESDVEPADQIVCTGEVVKAEAAEPVAANRELAPLLVLAALGLVIVEWIVYTTRVRV